MMTSSRQGTSLNINSCRKKFGTDAQTCAEASVESGPFGLCGAVLYFAPALVLSLISGTQEAEAVQSLFAKASRGLLIQHTTHDLMLELLDKITATEGLRRFSLFLEAIDLLSHTSGYEFLASEHYHNPMTVKDAGRTNYPLCRWHPKAVITISSISTNVFATSPGGAPARGAGS